MRNRIRKSKLVASTNPRINGSLAKPINLSRSVMVGTRVGRDANAVLECSIINTHFNTKKNTGTFDSITNKKRVIDRTVSKLSKKIGWI